MVMLLLPIWLAVKDPSSVVPCLMVNVPLPMLLRMAVAVSPNAPRMAEAVSFKALCNAVLSVTIRFTNAVLSVTMRFARTVLSVTIRFARTVLSARSSSLVAKPLTSGMSPLMAAAVSLKVLVFT